MRRSLVGLLMIALCAWTAAAGAEEKSAAWKSLFDGKTLKGWKSTDFAGHAEVEVKDGRLILQQGSDMTGVTYSGEFPKMNYEIELDAMRVDGTDFFCGLTFPYGKDPCSLIVGGWGGGVVGLSSINGFDASENETTEYKAFEKGKWYHIRLRVTSDKIQAWVDKDQLVNVDTADKKFSIRSEVELSMPLGFASWCTTAALKDIKFRTLADEKPADKK